MIFFIVNKFTNLNEINQLFLLSLLKFLQFMRKNGLIVTVSTFFGKRYSLFLREKKPVTFQKGILFFMPCIFV